MNVGWLKTPPSPLRVTRCVLRVAARAPRAGAAAGALPPFSASCRLPPGIPDGQDGGEPRRWRMGWTNKNHPWGKSSILSWLIMITVIVCNSSILYTSVYYHGE